MTPAKKQIIRALLMLGMLLACSGCFQQMAENITDQCYDDVRIVERRGRISENGKNLTIYQKKRTDYRRDPLGLWKGSFEEETTHTYPLDAPPKGAVLQDFDFTYREGYEPWRVVHRLLLDVKNSESSDAAEDGQVVTFLPAIPMYNGKKPGTPDRHPIPIFDIAPDDIQLLSSGPFVWNALQRYDDNALVIPYKMEGNICHAYLVKEKLVNPPGMLHKPNLANKILRAILVPPAFVLDVVTSPVQIVIFLIAFQFTSW